MLILATNDRTGKSIDIRLGVHKHTAPGWRLRSIITGYRVRFVNRNIEGDVTIGGENYWAAKEFKLEYPYPPTTILVTKQHPGKTKEEKRKEMIKTIAHEIIESEIMSQGINYEEAHKCANQIDERIVETRMK